MAAYIASASDSKFAEIELFDGYFQINYEWLPQIQRICSDFANLNLFTTIFRGFSQLFLRICFWIEPPYEGFEDYL